MPKEGGDRIMKGLGWNDPLRVRTDKELEQYIREVGFLPLFANEIPGFSAEEHVSPDFWWTGIPEQDPWEWRILIAARGETAYGKFFGGRAGFISREWFPYFANWRRDGYDFDSRWEDGLARDRSRKLMQAFEEDEELFSFEAKRRAGFGKNGEKNFDGICTELQQQTYLVVRDFRRRVGKSGAPYGWPISVLCTPEHLYGSGHVSSAYGEEPEESARRIRERVKMLFPEASDEGLHRVLGFPL